MISNDAIDALFKRVVKYLGVELTEYTTLSFEGDGVTCIADHVHKEIRIIIPSGGGAGVDDATTSSKGIVRLNGDLRGTATDPLVASLTGDESGILIEKHTRTLCDEPASMPHSRFLAGRFEIGVNNTTVDLEAMSFAGADACTIRVTSVVVAQDANFAASSAFSAAPTATFKWSGSALTRIGDGTDPLPVTASFTGGAEWIVDGSSIKLRLTSPGNVRFNGEYALTRIR